MIARGTQVHEMWPFGPLVFKYRSQVIVEATISCLRFIMLYHALVTPTDRPKSVRNRCLIELFCGVVCVVTLPF